MRQSTKVKSQREMNLRTIEMVKTARIVPPTWVKKGLFEDGGGEKHYTRVRRRHLQLGVLTEDGESILSAIFVAVFIIIQELERKKTEQNYVMAKKRKV